MRINLYKKLKSEFVWILFVCISFTSSLVLLNEYSKYEYSKPVNTSIIKAVENEDAGNEDSYQSNDFVLLQKLAAVLSRFFQSQFQPAISFTGLYPFKKDFISILLFPSICTSSRLIKPSEQFISIKLFVSVMIFPGFD